MISDKQHMLVFLVLAAFLSTDIAIKKYDAGGIENISCAGDSLRGDVTEKVKLRLGSDQQALGNW